MTEKPPSNQELRTRKDLLLAAGRLLKKGRKPTMDEVAEEALVSRATAYRYFKNVEDLLVEAPVDLSMPDPGEFFARNGSTDPEERIDEAEAMLHRIAYDNEAQLRLMLGSTLNCCMEDREIPRRQNRRTPLIEAALAPARSRLNDEDYDCLCSALALIFGTESMIVFRDVLHLDEEKARQVKSWAVRALVRAALESSDSKTG